jgi:hypothetical protein
LAWLRLVALQEDLLAERTLSVTRRHHQLSKTLNVVDVAAGKLGTGAGSEGLPTHAALLIPHGSDLAGRERGALLKQQSSRLLKATIA